MSETNVTIINMQPTTDYVNIGGPLINPSEYATKNEINEKLDNYATVKQATDIARNITDSALENGYYTSSEIDGKLDCKSNTDHTHTDLTLKTLNDMPIIGDNGEFITTYPFIPTVGWYPFNVMQNLDFHNKVKSGYIWRLCAYTDTIFQIVNNGYVRLTIDKYGTYIDKNLRCDTINGINTSDISLNTHNHDDKYALVDHTHTTNDVTDIDILAKADHNHDETYSKLEHTHTTSDIIDVSTLAKTDHNHDDVYSKLGHMHTFDESRENFKVAESFSIYRAYNYGSTDNNTREWLFITAYKGTKEYLRLYFGGLYLCYFENCDDDINLLNTTITHNAPLEESLDNYVIGKPVFISGNVYKLKEGKYVDRTDTTDCIPSVKTEGKYKEYLGIVVAKHKAGETVTVGDVVKHDVIISQDTIDFATHGDFYLKVNDSWPYQVGDTVLYNGDIVNDEGPMTNKIQRMIAGVVTAIVDPGTLAIFKA